MDAFIAFALVFGLVVVLWWQRSRTAFHESASSAQAIVTACAVLIAGYWYFVERKGQPHANVVQTVEVHRVSDGLVAVEVLISVENLGHRLLKLRRARIRVQQVEPARYDYEPLADADQDDLWSAEKPSSASGKRYPFFQAGELNWPIIREYNGPIENDIEPGEKDLVVATFFVRCGANEIRIASNVEKERSGSADPMMWKARSFADLKSQCEGKSGEAA